MARSDAPGPTARRLPFDWKGWLVVAWVAVFGSLYVRMMAESKAVAIAGVLRPLMALARAACIVR